VPFHHFAGKRKQAEEMKYRSNLLSIEVFPISNTLATIVTQ